MWNQPLPSWPLQHQAQGADQHTRPEAQGRPRDRSKPPNSTAAKQTVKASFSGRGNVWVWKGMGHLHVAPYLANPTYSASPSFLHARTEIET